MKRSAFDYSLDFKAIDFRERRELYRVGKGEQGVLLVEPYKSELVPHWRFKTVAEATKSSRTIYNLFLAYLKAGDFPGADMARGSSSRWAGPGRGATPTTNAGESTTRRPVSSYPGWKTRRRRQRQRIDPVRLTAARAALADGGG